MFASLFASASGEVAFLLVTPLLVLMLGYFGAYAAHSLVVVIEQTAGGFDRVAWPHETFFDWAGKLIHIVGLLALLLFPVGFLVPLLDFDDGPAAPLLLASTIFLILWLTFPVALLSSLSGSSRFQLVRWAVLKGLARCWPSVLVFYGITGVVGFLALGGLYFVIHGWQVLVQALLLIPSAASTVALIMLLGGLPMVAMLCATGLLWYARLLGRLGWMLQIVEPHREEEEEPDDEAIDVEVSEEADGPINSPAPPAPEEPLPMGIGAAGPVSGETYAMVDVPPTPPPPEPPPFRWGTGRLPPPAPPRHQWRDLPQGPRESAADLHREKPEVFTAPRVGLLLEPKVFFFPWYRTSLWAWITLTFGILCVTFIARLPLG